jgi:hypothetical protein
MKKHLVVMFALFLVVFSACENKTADVKPDAEPTTEENAGGTEAPKADAGAVEAKADAGKEAPKADAGKAEEKPKEEPKK